MVLMTMWAYMGVLITTIQLTSGQTLSETQTAYNATFFTNYNKNIRPLKDDFSQPLKVNVSLELISVDSYNSVTEILAIVVILHIKWTDEILTWTPATYGGLTYLKVGQSKIWLPELYNIKLTEKFEPISEEHYKAHVTYEGKVSWRPGGLLKVKCDPDVSNFPFDEQSCTVVLTPWGYDQTKVVLRSSAAGMDKNYFEKNGEWLVTDTAVSSDTVATQSVLKFDITIKRKSVFHGINTIAPMVILLVLNPLVFILPPQSEERINFSVTILLTFVVLLTVLTEVLPPNSKPMATINYTMITTLSLSSLCVLLTIIQLHLYHHSNESPVPRNLVRFVKCFKCCRTACKCKSRETEVQEMDSEPDDAGMTWKELALFLDRIYVIVGYVGIAIFIMIVLIHIAAS